MLNKFVVSLARKHISRTKFAFCNKKVQSQTKQTQQNIETTYDEKQQDIPFEKQNRNTWGWFIYRLFFWGAFSLFTYNIYLVNKHYTEQIKTPIKQAQGAVSGFLEAAQWCVNKWYYMEELLLKPPSKKLLPDVVHPLYHPKTLVLQLSGALIKTDYIFGKGQIMIRRPSLQKFLKHLSRKYQIVIFSDEENHFIQQSILALDPQRMIFVSYFGKECMLFKNGKYIKDLRYLNRDLRKIIVIETDLQTVPNQPDNVILLPEYDGSESDQQLNKLLILLDCI